MAFLSNNIFSLIVASFFMLFSATVYAVKTSHIYQEPAGRFIIDLPTGYNAVTRSNGREYSFEGSGPGIMLVYLPKSSDTRQAYLQMRRLLDQNMKAVVLQGRIRKLELDGRQITLGKYKGFIWLERKISRPALDFPDDPLPRTHREPPFELIKIVRYAIISVVVLKNGAVGYISYYTTSQKQVWEKRLLNSLRTIRDK